VKALAARAGGRYLAAERGAFDSPQDGGHEVDHHAQQGTATSECDQPCPPRFPLGDIARYDATELYWLYSHLPRRSAAA